MKMYLRNGKVMSRIPKMPGKGGVRRSCKVLKGDAGPMAPALHRLLSEAMFHLMAELMLFCKLGWTGSKYNHPRNFMDEVNLHVTDKERRGIKMEQFAWGSPGR